MTDKAGSSGLSGGWTFIIIVFCFAFVYVVGGQLYLRYREEKTGVDACPNYEFWREIPSLVRDGCVFSYGKVVDLYKHYTDKSGAADDEDNYEQI